MPTPDISVQGDDLRALLDEFDPFVTYVPCFQWQTPLSHYLRLAED